MIDKFDYMKRYFIILLALMAMNTMVFAKTDKQTVIFYVDLHCQGCIDKIYKNIAYEKGVKDLKCDMETKTVVVTYDAGKTDIPTLQKAFAAINKPASLTPVKEHQESDDDHDDHHHHK